MLAGSFSAAGGTHRVKIKFDEDVSASLAGGDLTLLDPGTNVAVDPRDVGVVFNTQARRATWGPVVPEVKRELTRWLGEVLRCGGGGSQP